MKLNLRVNDYPIILERELDDKNLKSLNFKKLGFFNRLILKPAKDDNVWWAKNCGLKYLNDDFRNSIYTNLDTSIGVDNMFGTSAYLWFKENKLSKFTLQIIQNIIAAKASLKNFEKELIVLIGQPILSNKNFVSWETENKKLILEYPKQTHGYIHLMKKDMD